MLTAADAERFERCIAGGGVAVFPADTVYGLACDANEGDAARRLYALKGRDHSKPSAVMFFGVAQALDAVRGLGPNTRAALRTLCPGAVTLLLPNPARHFPAACGDAPETLGVRVPRLAPAASALEAVSRPVLQSSANLAGDPEARRLGDVTLALIAGADLALDAGELPGTPSTVIDLRRFELEGAWEIVREGAVTSAEIDACLR